MSILSDIIVYIWLLPVVAQIILPLVMLIFWLAGRPLYHLFVKQDGDVSSVAHLSNEAAK